MSSMSSDKGKHETLMLRANITDQLNRLLTQLDDLEELMDELDENEYNEEKTETLEQLKDFQAFLDQAVTGNMTLVDEFGAAQQTIQAAITQVTQGTNIRSHFMSNDAAQLRKRLVILDRDLKLKAISQDYYNRQAVEALSKLKKMGDTLSVAELELLSASSSSRYLETAGSEDASAMLSAASDNIKKATSDN